MRTGVWEEYEKEYSEHMGYKADPLEWLASNWQGAAIGIDLQLCMIMYGCIYMYLHIHMYIYMHIYKNLNLYIHR
jgi:hypothetical protein